MISQFDTYDACTNCFAARRLNSRKLCSTCERLRTQNRLTQQSFEELDMSIGNVGGIPIWDMLVRRTSKGKVQTWLVSVEEHEDNTATIVTTHGLLNGKLQTMRDRITKGKNEGRKNATTPLTQAIAEAQSAWNEKFDRECYGRTPEESDIKKLDAPMLAQSWFNKKRELTGHAKKVDWNDKDNLFQQPKFDGNRCKVVVDNGNIRMRSREGVTITTCDHIVDAIEPMLRDAPKSFILDGELYTHGVPVWKIRGWIAKKQPDTLRLNLVTYDMDIMNVRFAERYATLRDIAGRAGKQVLLTRTESVDSQQALMTFHDKCVAAGYEGAMLRHTDEGYTAGERSSQLLKVKNFVDAEFKIVDCHAGRGKYENLAVFVCVTADGHEFDVTAPGSHGEKAAYLENKDEYIGKKLTVKFAYMTDTDKPVPFQPVAKEVR